MKIISQALNVINIILQFYSCWTLWNRAACTFHCGPMLSISITLTTSQVTDSTVHSLLGLNVISLPADEAKCGPCIWDESGALSGRDGEWIDNLREGEKKKNKKRKGVRETGRWRMSVMRSLTFTPFGTSSVKGIWRLSWRVKPVRLQRTPAAAGERSGLPAAELQQDTVTSTWMI